MRFEMFAISTGFYQLDYKYNKSHRLGISTIIECVLIENLFVWFVIAIIPLENSLCSVNFVY